MTGDNMTAPSGKPMPLKVTYLRENSANWDRSRFRKHLDAAPNSPALAEIAHRRNALRSLAPHPLHQSYQAPNRSPARVTPDLLAISPAYGAVLFNLARSIEARLILEDGAGFGISSMYLAAAARQAGGGMLLSFEISDYATHAQASVNLVDPGSRVIKGSFAGFPAHLSGAAQVDFAFIDSMHDKVSMLRSFRSLIGWMAPQSIIVVDDLSYSDSAREGFRCMMRMGHHDFVAIVNNRFGVLIRG